MNMWARKQKGFTIIELIVIIVVIGILASIVYVSFTTVQKRSRDSQRDRDVMEIQRGLDKYYAANGMYPQIQTPSPVADGTSADAQGLATILVPTYMTQFPTPPSSATYQYVRGPIANSSYGIEMNYESKANCQRGNNNQGTTWWSSLPTCAS